MNSFLLWIIAGILTGPSLQDPDLQCFYPIPPVPSGWIHMTDPCLEAVFGMIDTKMTNAIQYVALGAYHARDSVNRPAVSRVFMEYADKDRDDAIELMDYLVLRGKLTSGVSQLLKSQYPPLETEWDSVTDALNFALDFEAKTTNQLLNTISTCRNQPFDDFHIDNWLSQYFLGDQYDDQKWLADLSSSLTKMNQLHRDLGEYFLDRDLQEKLFDEL